MTREVERSSANSNTLDVSRRRFLGSSGLAATAVFIGGALPLPGNGGGIPQAHAQAAPTAAPP